jgi:predicted transcriptional regulator
MTESHTRIETEALKILKERPISVSELAKKLKLRRDFLAGYLQSMCDRGKLKLITVGKAHVYLVTEKGGRL